MFSRPHPFFSDWSYRQPGDSQRLLDRQLAFIEAELKDNPVFSGMPPPFEQWCKTGCQQTLGATANGVRQRPTFRT